MYPSLEVSLLSRGFVMIVEDERPGRVGKRSQERLEVRTKSGVKKKIFKNV